MIAGLAAAGRHRLSLAAAALVGVAIPSLVAGRVPLGVALALAAVALATVALATGLPRATVVAGVMGRLRTPVGLAVAATFAVWLVSVAASMKPGWSLLIWGQTLVLIAAAAGLHGWLTRDAAARTLALKALVAAALAAGIIAATGLLLWPGALAPLHTRPIATFYDAEMAIRAYGSAVPCLVPAVVLAGVALGRGWRAAAVAYVPLALLVVYGTDSRAGLLGLGASIAALAVARALVALSQRWRRIVIAVLIAAAAAAAYAVFSWVPPPPYNCEPVPLPTWMIDAHRQIIWGFALDRAGQAPWTGWGIDVGGSLPGAKVPLPACIGQNYLPSHAHDWILEILVETGVFGLGAALISLFLFARALVLAAARGYLGAWGAIGVAGAFWGSGLVNFSIWSAWWQCTFLVLTALTLAVPGAATAAGRRGPGRRTR